MRPPKNAMKSAASLTAAQIDAGTSTSGLQTLTGKAKCDVRVVAINYATVGVNGENTNASGALLVPGGACTGPFPLVAYAKGTDVQKPRTLANPTDSETSLLAAMYAAQGYAVVATDYLGFAKSAYSYHPYLHADSEATSVIDSVRAARAVASLQGISLSGKVMLTGYSQGGHAAMALQRAVELDPANEFEVTASAPMSGPYSIGEVMRALILSDEVYYYPAYIPNTALSYQTAYGNIFTQLTDIFKPVYAAPIQQFYEGNLSLSDLNTQLISLLVAKGIIDPTKVVRAAIQNAASAASLLITTEAMIAEVPKKGGAAAPAMPGGGMDF